MKSAYAILRVPANADEEATGQAYDAATRQYPREILIENPALSEGLQEVNEAYKILSTRKLRQMHDRKLSATLTSPKAHSAYLAVGPGPSNWGVLKIMLVTLIAVSAIWTHHAHTREESRKARLAHELALKKDDAKDSAQEQTAAEAVRTSDNALADGTAPERRAESAATVGQAAASQTIAQ